MFSCKKLTKNVYFILIIVCCYLSNITNASLLRKITKKRNNSSELQKNVIARFYKPSTDETPASILPEYFIYGGKRSIDETKSTKHDTILNIENAPDRGNIPQKEISFDAYRLKDYKKKTIKLIHKNNNHNSKKILKRKDNIPAKGKDNIPAKRKDDIPAKRKDDITAKRKDDITAKRKDDIPINGGINNNSIAINLFRSEDNKDIQLDVQQDENENEPSVFIGGAKMITAHKKKKKTNNHKNDVSLNIEITPSLGQTQTMTGRPITTAPRYGVYDIVYTPTHGVNNGKWNPTEEESNGGANNVGTMGTRIQESGNYNSDEQEMYDGKDKINLENTEKNIFDTTMHSLLNIQKNEVNDVQRESDNNPIDIKGIPPIDIKGIPPIDIKGIPNAKVKNNKSHSRVNSKERFKTKTKQEKSNQIQSPKKKEKEERFFESQQQVHENNQGEEEVTPNVNLFSTRDQQSYNEYPFKQLMADENKLQKQQQQLLLEQSQQRKQQQEYLIQVEKQQQRYLQQQDQKQLLKIRQEKAEQAWYKAEQTKYKAEQARYKVEQPKNRYQLPMQQIQPVYSGQGNVLQTTEKQQWQKQQQQQRENKQPLNVQEEHHQRLKQRQEQRQELLEQHPILPTGDVGDSSAVNTQQTSVTNIPGDSSAVNTQQTSAIHIPMIPLETPNVFSQSNDIKAAILDVQQSLSENSYAVKNIPVGIPQYAYASKESQNILETHLADQNMINSQNEQPQMLPQYSAISNNAVQTNLPSMPYSPVIHSQQPQAAPQNINEKFMPQYDSRTSKIYPNYVGYPSQHANELYPLSTNEQKVQARVSPTKVQEAVVLKQYQIEKQIKPEYSFETLQQRINEPIQKQQEYIQTLKQQQSVQFNKQTAAIKSNNIGNFETNLQGARTFTSLADKVIDKYKYGVPVTMPITSKVHPTLQIQRNQSNPYNKIRILCIGDSLTSGYYGNRHIYHPYSVMLSYLLNTNIGNEFELVTRGVGGEKSHQQMYTRLQNLLVKERPLDLVIILGGLNDLIKLDLNVDIFADVIALHELCHLHGVSTVSLTIPETRMPLSRQVYANYNQFLVVWGSLNEKIRHYSSNWTIPCDLAREFPLASLSDPEKRAWWSEDYIHPTIAGYDQIGRIIYNCVVNIL